MTALATSGFDLAGWARDLSEQTEALAQGRLGATRWQQEIDRLYAQVDISVLTSAIDLDSLRAALRRSEVGEKFVEVPLGPGHGVETKVAALRRGASIPPHGHENQVSAFLILSGSFHVRLYDRVSVHTDAYTVRQSGDGRIGPGEWTSSSDERDNVHWLTATSDECILFSAKRTRVRPDVPHKGRRYLDVRSVPHDGTPGRATFLDRESAYDLFGSRVRARNEPTISP